MDHTMLIRLIAGALAVAVFGIIVWRRNRTTE
jgi:hypothetical protein